MAPTTRSATWYTRDFIADRPQTTTFPSMRRCITCHRDLLLHNFSTWFCNVKGVGPLVCEACAADRREKRRAEDEIDGERPARRRRVDSGASVARSRSSSVSSSDLSVKAEAEVKVEGGVDVKREISPKPEADVKAEPEVQSEVKIEIKSEHDVKSEPLVKTESEIKTEIKTETEIKTDPLIKLEIKPEPLGEPSIKSEPEPEMKPDPDANPDAKEEDLRDRALFWMTLKNCIRAAEDRVGMELAGVMIDDYAEEEGLNFLFLNLD